MVDVLVELVDDDVLDVLTEVDEVLVEVLEVELEVLVEVELVDVLVE